MQRVWEPERIYRRIEELIAHRRRIERAVEALGLESGLRAGAGPEQSLPAERPEHPAGGLPDAGPRGFPVVTRVRAFMTGSRDREDRED